MNNIVWILSLFVFCAPMFGHAQVETSTHYSIENFKLQLISPDSTYIHFFECPRIVGMNDSIQQRDINHFLKSVFLPSRREIRDFKDMLADLDVESEMEEPHWDYLESIFKINFQSSEILSLERKYLHEFKGMMQGEAGASFYTFDMTSGEWIEHLYEFVYADSSNAFNKLLRSFNRSFRESEIFIDVAAHKDFSIYENKDTGLWLVLYIPPFGEFLKLENGERITYSNDYLPMRFEIPMEEIKHLIVEESMLYKVIKKRAQ